jgi:hypothetical protein
LGFIVRLRPGQQERHLFGFSSLRRNKQRSHAASKSWAPLKLPNPYALPPVSVEWSSFSHCTPFRQAPVLERGEVAAQPTTVSLDLPLN